MRVWRAALVAMVLVAGVLSVSATPATAARVTFEDGANDASRSVDIRSVRVVNEDRVAVRTTFQNLVNRECGSTSLLVYLDTARRNAGPEYVLAGQLFCEWDAFRVEGWRDHTWRRLLQCDIDLRTRAGRGGSATFDVDRSCLRRPGGVRVAVKSSGLRGSSDWAPRRLAFYPSVHRH
jgi:hypothetical protein